MASQPRHTSACSVLLPAPFGHCCDEDRQPRPAPQQSSAGPDEALHTWGVSFPFPVGHQLPATAAATITTEAADPAAIQQRQHTITCWWVLLLHHTMTLTVLTSPHNLRHMSNMSTGSLEVKEQNCGYWGCLSHESLFLCFNSTFSRGVILKRLFSPEKQQW